MKLQLFNFYQHFVARPLQLIHATNFSHVTELKQILDVNKLREQFFPLRNHYKLHISFMILKN